jgi:AraC-like DNA-binding protein
MRRVLWEAPGIAVQDFRCRAVVHPLGPEEPVASHSIAFVRRGVFRRRDRRETVLADASQVLFFHAGEPYRYEHPVTGGDDCTIVALDTATASELVARHAPAAADRLEAPFPVGHALSSRRAVRLLHELLARIRAGGEGRDALAMDDLVADLAQDAVASACAPAAPGPRGADAIRRRRDLVEAAKLALDGRLDAPPRLSALAAALQCSPFHLSRTFREVAGLSLRRYVGRLRARLAAERLAEGARDLTALALDLGYADHSHFTNAFRREWGTPPSAFRARTSAAPGR